jgi:two-component system, sensor histidine kinase
MDGFEATLEIRKDEADQKKHIPIIALTANATEEDKNRCMQTGMDDFLTKPIKSEKLYECLHKYIK